MSHILGSNTVTKEILPIRTHKKYRHKHLVVVSFLFWGGKKKNQKNREIKNKKARHAKGSVLSTSRQELFLTFHYTCRPMAWLNISRLTFFFCLMPHSFDSCYFHQKRSLERSGISHHNFGRLTVNFVTSSNPPITLWHDDSITLRASQDRGKAPENEALGYGSYLN